jgi:hypothetical protein
MSISGCRNKSQIEEAYFSMLKTYLQRALFALFCTGIFSVNLAAQTAITPLNTLIPNGSLTAGDVTFSNFKIPKIPPANFVGVLPPEFNDIGVSATVNSNGTVSLAFVSIDPATGAPSPLVTSAAAAGDLLRAVTYTVTVNNQALRIHSVDQAFGAGTTITGNTEAFNGLYGVEPVSVVFDELMFDSSTAPPQVLRGAMMPSPDGSGLFSGNGGILMPGGDLATYNMANEWGLLKGHAGFDQGGTLDSITETFALVPAGGQVPLVTPVIAQFNTDSTSAIANVVLSDFAQEGGAVVTLASSNPSALALPPSITVPQGYKIAAFPLNQVTVDTPTVVTLSATLNGQTLTQPYTVNPSTPLSIAGFDGFALITGAPGFTLQTPVTSAGASLLITLNRVNFSDATIQLRSSNPALAPVQASLTIPAFSSPGDFRVASVNVPFQLVSVDTPVTFSATLNGVTTNTTVTIPKTVDQVAISKAQLVVKNGQLRVEATGSVPSATLSLFNAATGQFLGNMTFGGLSGGGAKFSFQGTVSPVTSLRLVSNFSGTATSAVSQK